MKRIILISIITALLITSLVSCLNNASSNEQTLISPEDPPYECFSPEINKGLTEKDAEKIKPGMTLDETVNLIGRPQRDVGSGTLIMEWDLNSGKAIDIAYILDNKYDAVTNDGIFSEPAGNWVVNAVEVKDKLTVIK